jgi:chemotaxis protein CheX
MKPANEALNDKTDLKDWQPMLEVATKEVFEIMLGCTLETLTGELQSPTEFTSMVGLAGQVCGVLTLRSSTHSAAVMAGKMLGITPTEANPEMWDAIGEICNMIAGNFKNKLAGLSDKCMLSVPTVITGADYNLHSLADSGMVEARFSFEGEPILVALEIQS